MPDPEVFGVLFVPQDKAERLLRKPGNINEIVVCVDSPSARRRVLLQAKKLLAVFGIIEAIPREQQSSHELLEKDIQSFRALSVLFPFLFFVISGLSIYALINRMLITQRPLIGILMAWDSRLNAFSSALSGSHFWWVLLDLFQVFFQATSWVLPLRSFMSVSWASRIWPSIYIMEIC
ncbi:MAG: hypothetical protein HYU64_11240 [Armatimonadetes bacterium]|nr:hypothetical protein [Armatimonadota bacterium]